jgi:hypothetical protein
MPLGEEQCLVSAVQNSCIETSVHCLIINILTKINVLASDFWFRVDKPRVLITRNVNCLQ